MIQRRHEICGPECRYRSLYEGAQTSLSDLAGKQASVLAKHAKLRMAVVSTLKAMLPRRFAELEQRAQSRLTEVDDDTFVSYVQWLLSAPTDPEGLPPGVAELRDALAETGIDVSSPDPAVWAKAVLANHVDPWATAAKVGPERTKSLQDLFSTQAAASPAPVLAEPAAASVPRDATPSAAALEHSAAPTPPQVAAPVAAPTPPQVAAPVAAPVAPVAGSIDDFFGVDDDLVFDDPALASTAVEPSTPAQPVVLDKGGEIGDLGDILTDDEPAFPQADGLIDAAHDDPSAALDDSSPFDADDGASPFDADADTSPFEDMDDLSPFDEDDASPFDEVADLNDAFGQDDSLNDLGDLGDLDDLGDFPAPDDLGDETADLEDAPPVVSAAPLEDAAVLAIPATAPVAPSPSQPVVTPEVSSAPQPVAPQPPSMPTAATVVPDTISGGTVSTTPVPPAKAVTDRLFEMPTKVVKAPALRPEIGKSSANAAKRTRKRTTKNATTPDLDLPGTLLPASLDAESMTRIDALVAIPRPVFTSDLISQTGSAELIEAWQEHQRRQAGITFIAPKRRHRLRGSLLLPTGWLRDAQFEFHESWWAELVNTPQYRGAVIYELGALLHRVGDQVVSYRISPDKETVLVRLRTARGIIGVVVAVGKDLQPDGATANAVAHDVEELFRERCELIAVLSITEEGLDEVIGLLDTEAQKRKWRPTCHVVAAHSWEYADGAVTALRHVLG